MGVLRMLFVWWRNATPGTLLNTWFRGIAVGCDQFGNRYYRSKDGKHRWVLYNGTVEASRVPPIGMAGCITPSKNRQRNLPRSSLGRRNICPI